MNKINFEKLNELAYNSLYSRLIDILDYKFIRGVFYRELSTGVRHLIIIDFNKKKNEYYVIIGVNSKIISGDIPEDEAGAYVTTYLSANGVSSLPKAFKANDLKSAEFTMTQLRKAINDYGLVWLDNYKNLSDFANALSDQYDLFKGKLFLADGKKQEAKQWLLKYSNRLSNMNLTADVDKAMRETKELLLQCDETIKTSGLNS